MTRSLARQFIYINRSYYCFEMSSFTRKLHHFDNEVPSLRRTAFTQKEVATSDSFHGFYSSQMTKRDKTTLGSDNDLTRTSPCNSTEVHDERRRVKRTVRNQRQEQKEVSGYESIASLMEEENNNLKQQNKFLLEKLRQMKERQKKARRAQEAAQKYKKLYQNGFDQIQKIMEEKEAYKKQAEELKHIALKNIKKLELKVKAVEDQYNTDGSESLKNRSTETKPTSRGHFEDESSQDCSLTQYCER